ncbi:iron-sulfur cluster insertion protein ErpA [Azohydromonas caseinilytica]|uniref:Putative iron-sulfur cluster insertion protein ErpA n=1 Tax=Azohydromonas caseinilytica TaxID=2728836 RepID=A0A848FCU4_9BURK|nr:iron-sulfur cluster insertion protein ErpA [Azohydromonas caseinilytica]
MACQSQPDAAGSCSASAAPPMPVELPEGADPIRLTDAVVSKVSEMLAEENDPALQLRIFVTGGGCSGFQYGFAFDDERKEDDFRIEREGVKVVVDAMSMQYLVGAEIDYEDKLEGARFVIKNPNASSTCGCGSSFSV